MNPLQWLLQEGDALNLAVAIGLLCMSVATWVLIVWKGWWMQRVRADLPRALAALWQAPTLEDAQQRVSAVDREQTVLPLVEAALRARQSAAAQSLGSQGTPDQRVSRELRQALHGVAARLQTGQVLLATVGATSPFVGLLGTVWGIYNALVGMASAGQITIERIAGPVGEALIMTAAGLAVAIPAVLAYNVLGRLVTRAEADLEGVAHDLRELVAPGAAAGRN